jgi:hypothetical protein
MVLSQVCSAIISWQRILSFKIFSKNGVKPYKTKRFFKYDTIDSHLANAGFSCVVAYL